MAARFFLTRFSLAWLLAATVLFFVQILKGFPPAQALSFAAVWGSISAGIFALVGTLRLLRQPSCMLPKQKL